MHFHPFARTRWMVMKKNSNVLNEMHLLQFPDGKWTNWSVATTMVHSRRQSTDLVIKPQHIGHIFDIWKRKRRNTSLGLAFEVPPRAIIASGIPIPETLLVRYWGFIGTG